MFYSGIILITGMLIGCVTSTAPSGPPMCHTSGINGLEDDDTGVNEAGSSVSITCESRGGIDPFPQLSWTRNSDDLDGDLTTDERTLRTSLALRWTLSDEDDGKMWTCTAAHPDLTQPGSCSVGPIRVLYGPDIVLEPVSAVKDVGEDVTFACSATGNPVVLTTNWLFDNSSTPPNTDRFVVNNNDGSLEVTVHSVTKADYSMELKCRAESSRGVSEIRAMIVPINETVYSGGHSRHFLSGYVLVLMVLFNITKHFT